MSLDDELRPDEPQPEPPTPHLTGFARWRARRPGQAIETVLLASTACLLAAVAWPIASGGFSSNEAEPATASSGIEAVPSAPAPKGEAPAIQIALLLDTSSSMDGLINQARAQLWSVVTALDSATFHGDKPRLEIALYEYGNDGLDQQGWIRQVRPFTSELDLVSESLFGLSTNGGSEWAGMAIARSVSELQWKDGDNALRVLYIAGNEDFGQGPTNFREAIAGARGKGIVVNTVNCIGGGSEDTGWAEAAQLSGGKFLRIDHNQVEQHIAAPQDKEIAELGEKINGTYIRYGRHGERGLANQIAQDNNASSMGFGSSLKRSVGKGSGYYRNPSWDLIDAIEDDGVALKGVERDTLPEEFRSLSDDELKAVVADKAEQRKQMQKRLGSLATERASFVAAERARLSGEDLDRLDSAMISSIVEQATAVGFTLNRT